MPTTVGAGSRQGNTSLPQGGGSGRSVGDPALVFDSEQHIYRLGERRLLSVTQVLRRVGLIEDDFYTEESRIRGRYVHQAITYEEREGLDDSSVDERLEGYVAAYRGFVRDVRPGRCLLLEQPLAHRLYQYAGTPDQIREIKGHLALLDHKTGQPAPWHGLQTAAYVELAYCMASLWWTGATAPRLRRYVLYLRPDGTYRLVEQTDSKDWKLFLAALAVAQFAAQHEEGVSDE